MKIVSTWKNTAYRQSFTAGAQVPLPVNLIGEVELTDAALEAIHGAGGCGTNLLNGNNSHNDNGNVNVLSGNSILNNASILNNPISGIGILGSGSSRTSYQGSGGRSDSCR
jgi:mersacidin/lichenicidin family type 2 lantibiotic